MAQVVSFFGLRLHALGWLLLLAAPVLPPEARANLFQSGRELEETIEGLALRRAEALRVAPLEQELARLKAGKKVDDALSDGRPDQIAERRARIRQLEQEIERRKEELAAKFEALPRLEWRDQDGILAGYSRRLTDGLDAWSHQKQIVEASARNSTSGTPDLAAKQELDRMTDEVLTLQEELILQAHKISYEPSLESARIMGFLTHLLSTGATYWFSSLIVTTAGGDLSWMLGWQTMLMFQSGAFFGIEAIKARWHIGLQRKDIDQHLRQALSQVEGYDLPRARRLEQLLAKFQEEHLPEWRLAACPEAFLAKPALDEPAGIRLPQQVEPAEQTLNLGRTES